MQKETLSLFIDGEEINESILDELSTNKALQQDWHNYHLIREALRGSLHDATINLDIAARIEAAIENDPVYVHHGLSSYWHRLRQQISSKKWLPSFSPIAQFGVAACTALFVIVGVQQLNSSPDDDAIPALNTVPIGITPAPAGYSADYFKQSNEFEKEEKSKILLMLRDYEQHRRTYIE